MPASSGFRDTVRVLRFAGGRLAGMLIALLIITFVTYMVFYLLPSDPARMSCGRPCTPQNLDVARDFMGVGDPWWQQFVDFLSHIPTGRTYAADGAAIDCSAPCLGYSFQQNAEVLQLIGNRLPVTISIAIGAALTWLLIGVGGGVLSAYLRGTALDRITTAAAIAGVSAPAYLVGLLGIGVLGFAMNVVPVHGYVQLGESPLGWAWHLILPWMVLAFLQAGVYARLTRGQMLEELGEDYIRAARARGLSETRVVGKHALRNALLPVVTVFGLDLGALLGGTVITEQLFGMPGVGAMLIDAVNAFDLPLVLGCTLLSAFFISTANLLVDLLYGVLDPRARLT